MKGLRTLAINAAIMALVAVLTYLTSVDWTEYVSPTVAVLLTAAFNFGLRFLTDTKVGQSS